MGFSDLSQNLIQVLDCAFMRHEHLAVGFCQNHEGRSGSSEGLVNVHFSVGENGERNAELVPVHFDVLGFVSNANREHLDILFQSLVFLDDFVEPINYRRALVAIRSERADNVNEHQFGRNLGYGEGILTFQAQILLDFRRLRPFQRDFGHLIAYSDFLSLITISRIGNESDKNKSHQARKKERCLTLSHSKLPRLLYISLSSLSGQNLNDPSTL